MIWRTCFLGLHHHKTLKQNDWVKFGGIVRQYPLNRYILKTTTKIDHALILTLWNWIRHQVGIVYTFDTIILILVGGCGKKWRHHLLSPTHYYAPLLTKCSEVVSCRRGCTKGFYSASGRRMIYEADWPVTASKKHLEREPTGSTQFNSCGANVWSVDWGENQFEEK
jgi:hypothetical protein